MKHQRWLLLAILLSLLIGCGQMGPLYLPAQPPLDPVKPYEI